MSREVLAPPLMRMGPSRCYRVNVIHENFSSQHGGDMRAQGSNKTYAEEDLYGEDYDDDCDIEEINNDVYKLSIHVASSFYGGIIGQKGSTIRRMESEGQCEITLPSGTTTQRSANSKIIIKGKTRNGVLSTKRKIQILVTSMRKRMKPTHFYGIALNYGSVKEKFIHLKKEILASDIPGINESLFQSENCIHLTFGVCVLMDDYERAKAVEILQSCREFLNELKYPLSVRVSGLEIMNDDPSSVRVLYALIHSDELQEFSNRCFDRFNASGLGFDDFNRGFVKLHMTIMNSRYSTENVKTFDARNILKQWNSFDFGTVQCNELLLCILGGSSKDKTTFYKTTDSLKF